MVAGIFQARKDREAREAREAKALGGLINGLRGLILGLLRLILDFRADFEPERGDLRSEMVDLGFYGLISGLKARFGPGGTQGWTHG